MSDKRSVIIEESKIILKDQNFINGLKKRVEKYKGLPINVIGKINLYCKSSKLSPISKRILVILICFLVSYLSISKLSKTYVIAFNLSHSLPTKIFIIKKGIIPTHRGQIFAFKLNNNHIYHDSRLVKRVGGLPSDKISIIGRDFYINNNFIGTAKFYSLKGDPLFINHITGVIPDHKFFAYTTHKDSYDSRYQEVGLIDEKDIIGTAVSIF